MIEPLCAIISMRDCSGDWAARLAFEIASAVSASSAAAVAACSTAASSWPASRAAWRAAQAAACRAASPASGLVQPGNINSWLVYSWFECSSPCSELSEPRGSGK